MIFLSKNVHVSIFYLNSHLKSIICLEGMLSFLLVRFVLCERVKLYSSLTILVTKCPFY